VLQPLLDRDSRIRREHRRSATPSVEQRVRAEVLGIALLALALLSVVSLIAPQGVLLAWWRDGVVALLGWGAPAVPVILTVFGLAVWVSYLRLRLSAALIGTFCTFVTLLSLLQIALGGTPEDGSAAGGYVGLLVSDVARAAVGDVGASICLGALFIASIVLAANRPLADLARPLWHRRPRISPGMILPGRSAAPVDDEEPVRINPEPDAERGRWSLAARRDADVIAIPAPASGADDELVEATVDVRRLPARGSGADATVPIETLRRPRALDDEETPGTIRETVGPETASGVLRSTARAWTLPSAELLEEGTAARHGHDEVRRNIRVIEETLAHFAIAAKIVEVNVGPVVTRYELKPAAGVKLSRIEALQDDLALALAARSLRIEAPVPGKSVVGIEIPNLAIGLVSVRDVIESALFKASAGKLTVALGRDIAGGPVLADLTKLPHLLIAGQTGSGKSVCINAVITSLLLNATPEDVRLLLIDPKRVELTNYNNVPHLLVPVITEHDKILTALRWATGEMDRRYRLFAQAAARNVDRYNEDRPAHERIPYVVIVIDELADLMMVAPIDVEEAITRIAQLARATGLHLVIATQRPSVDVITGLIKANIPARIAFATASSIDSRTILDMTGAEKLLGRGDMLFLPPDQAKPVRAQGVYVSDGEIDRLTDFWRAQGQPDYRLSILDTPAKSRAPGEGEDGELGDSLFRDAVRVVTQFDRASASLLQRRLRIGYARAARLMDILEEHGVVGPGEGSKPRDVLITNAAAFLGDDDDEGGT
jgi:S-DNA-T family DNA segregation ATPase FtsK/SpoIIIE